MKWHSAEIKNFKAAVAAGFGDDELARSYGRSEPAIRRARQRFTPNHVTHRSPASNGWMDSIETAASNDLKNRALLVPIESGRIPLEIIDGGGWTRIGLVADTHLCCREERLDALNAQYDLFAKEGIQQVFHAGNIVDGYCAKINGASVYESSIDGQALYCAKHYPRRAGITTYFITGNDHDFAWNGGKEGFNGGAYLELICQSQGRADLKYIGHVECDIELRVGDFKQILKIQHPGGGSSYARSYAGQKMVESFEGGEKPAILAQGHFHVAGYAYDRNVHIIGLPGFQSQTIFGRTKHLRYEVGGVLLEFKQSKVTGTITRFRPEFNLFFDRGFYKQYLASDEALSHSPVVVSAVYAGQ